MPATVTNAADEHRYEARLDGRLAGFSEYRERPGLIAFVHTEVDHEFEGQGVGSALVRGELEDARSRGLAVLPFCPFVNEYIRRHPELVDLVPIEHREKFGL
jgi:predicted GNAT family acetyltransferase